MQTEQYMSFLLHLKLLSSCTKIEQLCKWMVTGRGRLARFLLACWSNALQGSKRRKLEWSIGWQISNTDVMYETRLNLACIQMLKQYTLKLWRSSIKWCKTRETLIAKSTQRYTIIQSLWYLMNLEPKSGQ